MTYSHRRNPRTQKTSGESSQVVVTVKLTSKKTGKTWHALGGGDTLEEALQFARESCPDGDEWIVLEYGDLYGD